MTQQRPPLLRRETEIDIPRLIADLKQQYSRTGIAFSLAAPESTVRRWEEGSTPNFEDGRALCLLYEKTFRHCPPVKVEARPEVANAYA